MMNIPPFQGKLLAIGIAAAKELPLTAVDSIAAMAGRGLAGDRYAKGKGVGQTGPAKPEQEATLIEQEAITGAGLEYKLAFTHLDTRRNLLTTEFRSIIWWGRPSASARS